MNMPDLVTLADAKLRLRVDSDDQDADIELMISGASVVILRYLDAAANEFLLDDSGVLISNPVIPADVQNAALYLVGTMLRDPDGAEQGQWDQGFLPRPVVSLLSSRRQPPLA